MDPNDNDFVCLCATARCGWRPCSTTRRIEQTFVLQCRPCGLSTTKTVEAPGRGGGAAEVRGFPSPPQHAGCSTALALMGEPRQTDEPHGPHGAQGSARSIEACVGREG
jgi:hypothetical protein